MADVRIALLASLALFAAAAAGAQAVSRQSGAPAEAPAFHVCVPLQVQEPDDPRWRWKLRTYNHLDCVTQIVDRALARAGSGGAGDGDSQLVTIQRAELERIRTLASWARDAAARIGQ